jgi:glutamate/tyrosine decarboxylase-like PLP-dependent enzyme
LICKKYGIWHHVDGALGGAFLLSENLRHHLGDLTNVDSLSWDPHKALLVPQQVTFFLCKH